MKRLQTILISLLLFAISSYGQVTPGFVGVLKPVTSSTIYHSPVTYNHTLVPSNQTDIDLILNITDTRFKTQANGGKVDNVGVNNLQFFSDAGYTTLMRWWIKFYSATTGQIVVYLRLSPSSSSDGTFYIGYGNPSVTTNTSAGLPWDANTVNVYPFADGTTLSATDPQGGYNGTITSATAGSGQNDGAMDCGTGSSAEYVVTSSVTHGVGTGDFTIESDFYLTNWYTSVTSATVSGIWSQGDYSPVFSASQNSTNTHNMGYYWVGWKDFGTGTTISLNTWSYAWMKRTGSTISGGLNGTTGASTWTNSTSLSNGAQSMGNSGTTYHVDHFPGKISDVIFSKVARSDDWLKTKYNAKYNGSFWTLGTQTNP
jgi:hypothetical protein